MASSATKITRFAPSPTGFLHIGGARTALFNWLYARHHRGRFLLRIEDTDRQRSTPEAIEAILSGLSWLGLDWDEEPVYQSARQQRHAEVAEALLAEGKAYRCYATPEELDAMREKARAEGRPMRYDGTWRDRDPGDAPADRPATVRFKAPLEGETVVADQVLGTVVTRNDQLDDMVLLRSDGTPTYMLAVVVDDHDMGITDIVRGMDHLTNAARQSQLFHALGWDVPTYAHVPLIHGPDGAKLSKRHGSLGIEAYRDMGYLPEALRNYLVRLGWSHGDDEVFSTEQAIEWFDVSAIGKSPARFDVAKLENLNAIYIREADDERLADEVLKLMAANGAAPPANLREGLIAAMPGLKERAKTLLDIAAGAAFLTAERPLDVDAKAAKLLDGDARARLGGLKAELSSLKTWDAAEVERVVRAFAEREDIKLGKIAQPLRAALTGTTVSPGIFDVLAVLGKEEAIARIGDQAAS